MITVVCIIQYDHIRIESINTCVHIWLIPPTNMCVDMIVIAALWWYMIVEIY